MSYIDILKGLIYFMYILVFVLGIFYYFVVFLIPMHIIEE